MSKKVNQTRLVAKKPLDANIGQLCKELHSRKCPNALNGLLVALNLHYQSVTQVSDGIELQSPGLPTRVLKMDAASATFAMTHIVNQYAVQDPEAIRTYVRHAWTRFKPVSATAPHGKYYTPAPASGVMEDLVNGLLSQMPDATLLDPAAGMGALLSPFAVTKCVAADFDPEAVAVLKAMGYQNVIETNSLIDVTRQKFGIGTGDKLIVLGNPPFNDGTSQHKRATKKAAGAAPLCDADLLARDTGASFMLVSAKLNADAIVMIHPLSYLSKASNFERLGAFASKYQLESGILVSSAEFGLGGAPFALVIAVYRPGAMTYADIEQFEFPVYANVGGSLLDSGTRLQLAAIQTTQGFIRSMTPTKAMAKVSTLGLYQYNFRDINFVISSGNLTATQGNSTIPVEMGTLEHYAYINCFKRHFVSDFVVGNLSPLVRQVDFLDNDFVDACIYDAIMGNEHRLKPFERSNAASIVVTKGILADAMKKAVAWTGQGVNPHAAFVDFWTTGLGKEALHPFFKAYFAKLKADNLVQKPTVLAAFMAKQAAALAVAVV